MTKSPRRPCASKFNFRLFVIIATCALVASTTAATAYMQRQKSVATPVVERPSVETQSDARVQKPAESSKVNTPLVGAETRPSVAQPELDAAALSEQAAALANRELALHPAARRTSPPSINAPVACSGAGGAWSAPSTWGGGSVPTAGDSVTITNGCTVTIDTAAVAQSVNVQGGGLLQFDSATARTLNVGQSVVIDSGGTFQSATTGTVTTHSLTVGADLTNNGTLDFSTNANTAGAGITFTGAASNTFGGTGATTDIRTLTINKGTSFANTLELNPSNLTVQGTTTDGAQMAFLTLTNGTLKVSGAFTMSARVFTTAAYTIPATAGFWLNNPNFTVAGQNGSPTNNGLLRISNGTYNIGTSSGNSMGAGALAVFIVEGGTLNAAGRLQTTSAVTYTQSGGAVNVSTVGNASSSSGSFGFSSPSSLINMSGGTINLVQASTAVTPVDYQFSGTANITGGTLNVGTAATATNFTFRIQGQMPSVVINNTTNNKNANLSAQGNSWGNFTINTGTTLNLNSQTLLMIGATLTNNGAITVAVNNSGSVNFAGGLGTSPAQTYQGTGTFGAAALRVASVALQNTSGVTLAGGVSALNVYRINAFFGQFTNTNLIAVGAGDATTLVVQRGATGIAFTAGSFDTSPAYNVGSAGLALVYSQSASAVTTGAEVPASRSILSLQIINPTGVTLAGGALSANGTTGGLNGLLLSSGMLTTSAANLLTLTGTATTDVSGGSAATYVNGPLERVLPASLASGSTYTFPVGKSSFKMFELVNPTTSAGGTVTVQVEVFDQDSGGTNGIALSSINRNRYWSATATVGAGSMTGTTVRLTEEATPTYNVIARSTAKTGIYEYFGGTVSPPTIGPSNQITSSNLGFFAIGTNAIPQTISGNFTVGAGGDFTTLTDAVAALNSRIMNGPVTFTLTDNTYGSETYPITINPNGGASATNKLTIKPAAGVTPNFTGSSTTALLILNGTDYVTIDGSNTVGGTTRNTTFTNTNTGTSSAVIWGQTVGTADPATNNTIKNLNITGNAPATTLIGIGFGSSTISSTSLGTRNDNNRVQNNLVNAVQFGIYTQGAASLNKNVGTVITGNTLGGAGASALGRAGIFAGFEDGVQITNNNVAGVSGAVTNTDSFGIALGSISVSASVFTTNDDVANATVTGNTVGAVTKTDTFSAMGISAATPNYGTTRIANNFVYGVVGNGTSGDFCAGIYAGANTASTTQIYFNSVSMVGGRDTGGSASQPSFALAVLGANPAVDIRDNALYNTQTATNGGAGGAAGSYAIGLSSVSPFTNITSNYNDLYTSGASSHFAIAGGLLLTNNIVGEQLTFPAWQSATGKDANSLSLDPLFTSATNLHLQSGSALINAGTTIAAVPTDIDGETRNVKPDIGADELLTPGSLQLSSATYNVSEGAGNLVVNVTRTGGTDGAASVHFFTSDGTAGSLDYTAQSGTLNWDDGDAANKTITIPINDDGLYEGSEQFNVTIDMAAGASLGSPSAALVTINDNDSPPSFSIDDVTHNEGNSGTTTYTFTVTKTGGTAFSSSVDFATQDGTATTADNDYQFNTGTLSFGPADTTMPVTVNVNGDATDEPDETFTVHLSNASNATISDADGTGTIKNDDGAADYTVTTTGNAIVVTDVSGNGDTLVVSEPAAGQIKFSATGRNFSVDGGANISGNSGNVSLSGINSITINQGGGDDMLSMQAFTSALPSLTINGDAGDDQVNFNGSVTFATDANLDVNLQDDVDPSGADSAFVASGVQVMTSGTGKINVRVSKTVIVGGLLQTQNGNLTVEANRQPTPLSGMFIGVGSAGGTFKTTGSGNISIKGTGGAGDFVANVGVQLISSAQVITSGTGTITIDGAGGAGAGGATAGSENTGVDIANLGTLVQSASGAIQITGQGGATNDTGSYGVVVEGGKVQTSGAGTLTITGNGGLVTGGNPTPVDSAGIFVVADDNGDGGVVTSTGTGANAGAIVMTGVADNGGAGAAQGLRVDAPGTVTSVDGNITFNGTGAACANACLGTSIRGIVRATGTGSIDITGTGAASTGAFPTHGVNVRSGGLVQTNNGGIGITGTGGNGADNAGFNLASTGTGTLRTTGNGLMAIVANRVVIRTAGTSATIDAGANTVQIHPLTNGTPVNLGSTTDAAANTLELGDAELDRITAAGAINVGDSNSGAVTISANITRASATNLAINSAANIDISGGSLNSAGGNVFLSPFTNTFPSLAGTDVNAGAGTLTLASARDLKIVVNNTTADTGYTQLNVAGQVNLNGANLSLSGSHTPSAGQTFIIVNNDGADAITGTFNGLPEGATISNFLGSALSASITYKGGDGNDAVLTVISPITASFSIDDVTLTEGDAGTKLFSFTITKSGTGAASVNFQTQDGTAQDGSDYSGYSGTASFAADETTQQVQVTVKGDTTPELNETFSVLLTGPSPNATITDNTGVGTILNDDESVATGQLIISEFRLRGPGQSVITPDGGDAVLGDVGPARTGASAGVGGIAPPDVDMSPAANDEFVELYNNTDSSLLVTTTDSSSGWTVVASGGVELFTVPNGTVIPARGHYLGANGNGYSLGAYAAPDAGWVGVEVPDNAGIALFRTHTPANYTMATRLDAVGSTAEADALYREGTGYTALAPADIALNLEHSFYRSLCSFVSGVGCTVAGVPKDSNDNAADFLFVDTQGTQTAAGKRLGAPGPENLSSPIQRNNAFGFALLDGTKSSSVAPNRVRDFTPGSPNNAPNGTLTIRRRVTNHTGAPITRLRFRVIELTTYPSAPGTADLRAISAEVADTVSNVGDAATCGAQPTPCTVDVEVTTLETPPVQANGGGYNSSLNAPTITLGSPLADGQSINLKFVLGVVQGGTFRIYLNIEAVNGTVPPPRPQSGPLRR